MDKMAYCNELMVRLEELLFQELSGCAAWKVEMVGVDFVQNKNIQGKTPDELIGNTIKEMVKEGLVEEMSHYIAGKGVLMVLNMKGCAHLPKEARLKKDGVKPYICPITNMILDQLFEKLGYETSYLSEIEIDEKTGECQTRSAIYADETKIGVVCDWNEELPPSL